MKRILSTILLIAIFTGSMAATTNSGHPKLKSTCTGSKNCNACKNCKYCKHCAKNGGKCGVCK